MTTVRLTVGQAVVRFLAAFSILAGAALALRRAPADVVLFGHSHLPHDERVGGVWYFNPASAGPRRFDYPVSVGIFEKVRSGWPKSTRCN